MRQTTEQTVRGGSYYSPFDDATNGPGRVQRVHGAPKGHSID
jgi:hypothetical protein